MTHDSDDMKMHRNWIRNSCVEHAIYRNKYRQRTTQEIINEAKEFERYIANTSSAEVLKLTKGGDND